MTLPAALADVPVDQLEDLVCRANPGVWAERRLGFVNAGFHWEWYRLMTTEDRLCILAPRDHAKTEVFTVNGTAWRCCYWPGWWTYVFAAIEDQAIQIKDRIDAAIGQVRPDLIAGARVMTKKQSVYANGARVNVAGAGKSVRGAHPDEIIGDDVLVEDLALTEHQRRKTTSWWFGTVGGMAHPGTTRVVRGHGRMRFPPTKVRLVGTPFHSQDLLMATARNRLWHFRRYAAEFDTAQLVPGSYAVEVRNG